MNVLEQTFKVLDYAPGQELKHIERIGRVCYKSEDKISEDDSSAKKFVSMLVKRGHTAMIEHASLCFSVNRKLYEYIKFNRDYASQERGQLLPIYCTDYLNPRSYVVSGNLRAWQELFETMSFSKLYLPSGMISEFERLPEIFGGYNFIPYDVDFRAVILYDDDLKKISRNCFLVHKRVSVKVVTDRGVSHEIVRHRPCSFGQESTRYVNYCLDKFGNTINVIDIAKGIANDAAMAKLPEETIGLIINEWTEAMEDAERHYMRMIELGATPQMARSVLPNSTKTEITITASLAEWMHFFKLRCDDAAHPQMREIAIPIQEEFNTRKLIA